MFKLNHETSLSGLQKIGAKQDENELKESKERRDYLEKLAAMHSGEDIYVEISGEQAYADIAKRDTRYGYTDRVVINVPAVIPAQVVSALDDETWNLLFQKTELYHELGHHLYTDWPSFEDVIFGDAGDWGVKEAHRGVFRDYWNILEDAAIEKQLAKRFNIQNDLDLKNRNLLENNHPADVHGSEVAIHQAVSIALMEYKHPIGWIDELLDEDDETLEFTSEDDRLIFENDIQPTIESYAPDIIAEQDPVERNIMVYQMYEAIRPYLKIADNPGIGMDMSMGFPDDGEKSGDGSSGMDTDVDEEDVELPEEERGRKEKYVDHNVQQDYSDEVDKQKKKKAASEGDDEDNVELEKWAKTIDKEYEQGTSMSLQILEDSDIDDWSKDRYQEAKRMAPTLARELEQKLIHSQRSKKQGGQRSGKPDSKNLHKTQQGDPNVFKRVTDPEDKDYSCMIVLDRSGSMDDHSGNIIDDAEEAAGTLALALDEVGVDTGQISMWGNEVVLEKPIGEDVDSAKERMFHGGASGGTPMSDAVALARERMEGVDHPFIIVVTDGEPDHRERYRDELHECDFPVLGVYLSDTGEFDSDHMNESAYFHALEHRGKDSALAGVKNLVKKVMF